MIKTGFNQSNVYCQSQNNQESKNLGNYNQNGNTNQHSFGKQYQTSDDKLKNIASGYIPIVRNAELRVIKELSSVIGSSRKYGEEIIQKKKY